MSKPRREEIAAEVYEDEVDLQRSGSYLHSSFRSVWSEHNVDPEDFRDELKKLYAQLEVNKTKKMTANNPHLSKKRGSRCTLGRSIIKRIAEIPVTVSRQCSREERDGSFRSRGGNHSDSFRRSPDSASISYRSSIKSPSPSIRKSQSDHYHVRERDYLLRDSSLRANSVKRCSQRSETDSLDIPPGVCKSVSAQNLTIDTNLLHPDHTRLHKSWSLSSSTTHSIENIPKISRSSTMRSRQSLSISDQTRSALQFESFDKAEVCPWEVEPEQSDERNQRHVTYANSEVGVENRPPSPQALVCPWDHLPPVEKTPSVEKETKTDNIPPKAPVTVSASAPGSPRPMPTKDQRVFSFRNTTNKWLSVKSFMGSMDVSSRSSKDGNLNREDSQKSQESNSTTPRSGSSSRRPSIEIRPLQKMGTTTDGKPSLVKQNAVRLSSGDSSDRSPRKFIIMKSAVYPGDADDIQRDGNYENVFLSRQSSKRSSISSISSRTPSTRRRGSNRIRPASSISHTDVCPWDGSGSTQQGERTKKQQTLKAAVCPQDSLASERSNVCPWESQEQGNAGRQDKGDVCPWESHNIPALSKDSQTQQSLKRAVDVCPWETVETPKISIRQDSVLANVCPWDVEGKPETVYENLNPLENKGTLTVPHQREAMKSAIYPGASKDVISNSQPHNTILPALNRGEQASKTAESCPWEFPDPPKIMDICPWEGGSKDPTNTDSNLQITIKVDVCPWETGNQGNPGDSEHSLSPKNVASLNTGGADSTRVNVCPWETETPEKIAATKTPQEPDRPSDVCPWETDTETGKPPQSPARQDGGRTNVCPWETEEATIVKSEVSKQLERQENYGQNVSPLKKVDTKVGKMQESAQIDVCPWNTEESKVVKKQDSIQINVCPWETEEPKTLKKQDSTRADVCPWDTEEPKIPPKDSTLASVCPWETEEPKTLQKKDSTLASICPWETEEPKTLQKKDSTLASVCPWETEEPKTLQKKDSTLASVCPWETEEPRTLNKQDSTQADVCPWDSEEPKSFKKQDNARADVCPWETRDTNVEQKNDGIKEDACPLETGHTSVAEKQETIREDICPSEREVPGLIKQDSGSGTDRDGVPDNQRVLSPDMTPGDMSTEQTDDSKASLALGRRDALCPWDLVRSLSGSFTDNTSDVFTWEPENIPEEDEEDDAECAAEALIFPPDL